MHLALITGVFLVELGLLCSSAFGANLLVDAAAPYQNSPANYTSGPSMTFGVIQIGVLSSGTLNQGTVGITATQSLDIGKPSGVTGTYNFVSGILTADAIVGSAGTGTLKIGTGIYKGDITLGDQAAGNGTLSIAGTVTGSLTIGNVGTGSATQTGGSVNANASSATVVLGRISGSNGTYTISGGTLGTQFMTVGSSGVGTFYQTGGTVTLSLGLVLAQSSTNKVCAYDLTGGTLATKAISTGSTASKGTSIFNFDGGTLQAAPGFINGNDFFLNLSRVNVRNGGAKIDTNFTNVETKQPFLHSDINGDAAVDGGLTKTGTGTLTLEATNTYTGTTRVANGTLAVGLSYLTGEISNSASITIDPGATLEIADLGTVRTGNITNNGRLRLLDGATLIVSGTLSNNGIIDASGYTGALPTNIVGGPSSQIIAKGYAPLSLTKGTSSVTVTIQGYAGHYYVLQSSDSLGSDASWTTPPNGYAPRTVSDGQVTITAAVNSSVGTRFYRVLIDP